MCNPYGICRHRNPSLHTECDCADGVGDAGGGCAVCGCEGCEDGAGDGCAECVSVGCADVGYGHVDCARVESDCVDCARVESDCVESDCVDRVNVDCARVESDCVDRVNVDCARVESDCADCGHVDRVHADCGHVDRVHADCENDQPHGKCGPHILLVVLESGNGVGYVNVGCDHDQDCGHEDCAHVPPTRNARVFWCVRQSNHQLPIQSIRHPSDTATCLVHVGVVC